MSLRVTLLLGVALAACALAACAPAAPSAPAAEPRAPLRLVLSATAELRGDTLHVDASLSNRSGRLAAIEFGACDLDVRGWRQERRAGQPDIDSRAAGHPESGMGRGCVLVGYTARIRPGETTSIADLTVLVPHLLKDDDPDGVYNLMAVFGYNEVTDRPGARRGADREVRARLGRLALDARRPPIGPEIVRGRRYTVEHLTTDGGQLRASVAATDVMYRTSFMIGFDTCAVTVLAYANAADRDQAPRAGAPVAARDAACGQPAIEPTIPAGAGRAGPFYAMTDAPMRADIDLPIADLLGGQPPGRYALALAVRPVGGFRRVVPMAHVYLSAGEVDWAGH